MWRALRDELHPHGVELLTVSLDATGGHYSNFTGDGLMALYGLDVRDPAFDTTGQKFLRGYQVTDSNGSVEFTTIYPGWYPGRAVHVHFKVRTAEAARSAEFISQLYFDEALSERIYATAPYANRGRPKLANGDASMTTSPAASAPPSVSDGASDRRSNFFANAPPHFCKYSCSDFA